MISICPLIKENRLNVRTRQNASRVTLKMQSGSYLQCPHWTLSKYNIVPLQQLSGSLEGWRLQRNELRINLSTYQDISKSAEVQGDFGNLSGTWRTAALAGRWRLPVRLDFSAHLIMLCLSLHAPQMWIQHTFKDSSSLTDIPILSSNRCITFHYLLLMYARRDMYSGAMMQSIFKVKGWCISWI